MKTIAGNNSWDMFYHQNHKLEIEWSVYKNNTKDADNMVVDSGMLLVDWSRDILNMEHSRDIEYMAMGYLQNI